MLLVVCALLDPAFEERDLFGIQWVVLIRWRHDNTRVSRGDPLEELARLRFARDDHARACSIFGDRAIADVQSQSGFSNLLVGAVTQDAVFSEDGLYLSLKVDRLIGANGRSEPDEQQGVTHEMVNAVSFPRAG